LHWPEANGTQHRVKAIPKIVESSTPHQMWWSEMAMTCRCPAAMGTATELRPAVRYRGFLLMTQANGTWLVRPERSPMTLLPFRTPTCSLEDVKALVDWRLSDGTVLTRSV
jgi:hypothetical protein